MAGLRDSKAALRREILLRREALAAPERSAAERAILEQILDLPAYQGAEHVLAYASFGSELTTDGLLRRVLEDGKGLFLPRVDRDEGKLHIHRVEDPARDLEPGAWGIREPRSGLGAPVDPGVVDFALVPGVAFDRHGWRLGYGGGFYDALISGTLRRGLALVSGAFACQVVEKVPRDEDDAPVELVITESGRYPDP